MKTTSQAINEAFAAIAHAARKLHPDEEHRERAARLRADLFFATARDLEWLRAYGARTRAENEIRGIVRGLCYATGGDVAELTRLAIRNPDDPAVARLKLHSASARYWIASRAMIEADRA